MLFDWLLAPVRHFQRRALLAEPFPEAWLPVLAALPFYRRLDPRGQQRIRDDLRVLIAEKNWEGCGGLVLTDEMRVTIAAQASLLLLNIEHEYYPHVKSILVYPSTYVHGGQQILGEAWFRGPVVLAWDSARHGAFDPRDGHNLVLHEFAHQLDLLDGLGDGTPPIRGGERYRQWVATMTAEFRRCATTSTKAARRCSTSTAPPTRRSSSPSPPSPSSRGARRCASATRRSTRCCTTTTSRIPRACRDRGFPGQRAAGGLAATCFGGFATAGRWISWRRSGRRAFANAGNATGRPLRTER
jgi:MtfA peptidase